MLHGETKKTLNRPASLGLPTLPVTSITGNHFAQSELSKTVYSSWNLSIKVNTSPRAQGTLFLKAPTSRKVLLNKRVMLSSYYHQGVIYDPSYG